MGLTWKRRTQLGNRPMTGQGWRRDKNENKGAWHRKQKNMHPKQNGRGGIRYKYEAKNKVKARYQHILLIHLLQSYLLFHYFNLGVHTNTFICFTPPCSYF